MHKQGKGSYNVHSYLKLNDSQLSPDYLGVELGIGESLLIKAIGESTGRTLALVKADLKKEGDLGLVAMVNITVRAKPLFCALSRVIKNSKNSQKTLFKPKPLNVPFVFQNLKEIALTTGNSVRRSLMKCQSS
jgi:DNA ligase-1